MTKSFTAQFTTLTRTHLAEDGGGQRNVRMLVRYVLILALMVTVYTVIFHVLMLREGQSYTWITGFYWTLTVMSTLGFGDITFQTDIGRLFSILVLGSGTIFLLVLLPFTFIEFFYEPWMKAQAAARAPRELPRTMEGHVLVTEYDALTRSLLQRLEQHRYDFALMVPSLEEALQLHDRGVSVIVGELDDPDAWRRARVDTAALVVSTATDVTNTSVAFTVRGVAQNVPIVTSAIDKASIDILELAGSNHVLRLDEMLGRSIARRVIGGDAMTHVIGRFDELLIAEATAHRTPIVGMSLGEARLREKAGVTVLGAWERGRFEAGQPETMIGDQTVLVMAARKEALEEYDALFCIYNTSTEPVVILGGGRVGRATARALEDRNIDYRIVEPEAARVPDDDRYVHGSAADIEILEEAGIRATPTVIITPHDDDLNVYLTIYCRRLRPDVQIITRATLERNVETLHRAGADMVLSYASMGAGAVMNVLEHNKVVMVAEGLNLFEVPMPSTLAGVSILDSGIRASTDCSVVAVRSEGRIAVVTDPSLVLEAGSDIVLIGTQEAESKFHARFVRE